MCVREPGPVQLRFSQRPQFFVAACWLLLVMVVAAMPSAGQVRSDASSSSTELKEGQTPEEVERVLGKPEDITQIKEDLVYTYAMVRVYFEHGKLVNVEERPAGTAQKKQSQGSQEQGAQAAEVLTNNDVEKMVKAKLGDGIIISTIKTSACNFDTSVNGMVKLKEAGLSDAVIQAMREAQAAAKAAENESVPAGNSEPEMACSDYESCLKDGQHALEAGQWDQALAWFQKASSLEPAKPDAWAALGRVYLASDQDGDVPAMWDKALQAGLIAFPACRERSLWCDTGALHLNPDEVSFVDQKGQKVFAVPSAQVVSQGVQRTTLYRTVFLELLVAGKKYKLDPFPFGIQCDHPGAFVQCPEPGVRQQLVIANYVSQTIPKLASGTFAKRDQPLSNSFRQPAEPAGNAGNSGQDTAGAPSSVQPLVGHYVNDQNGAEYLDLGSAHKFFWRVGGRDFTGSYEISGDILTLRFPPLDATARGKLAGGRFNCCLSNGLDPTASALIDDEGKNWVRQNAQEQPAQSGEPAKSASASSAELNEGQTPQEVEKVLGKPNDTMTLKGSLIYIYPTIKVVFESGKLVDVQHQQK